MVELVLVDADMLAGWRRATPSLTQLYQAVLHLERQHPQAEVTVIADPSLKWALSPADQVLFEADIVARVLTCAPAGTKGGVHGFIAAVAARMGPDRETVVVTDRAIAGLRLARVSVDDGRWHFGLDGTMLDVATAQRAASERGGAAGRRRTGRASPRHRPGPANDPARAGMPPAPSNPVTTDTQPETRNLAGADRHPEADRHPDTSDRAAPGSPPGAVGLAGTDTAPGVGEPAAAGTAPAAGDTANDGLG